MHFLIGFLILCFIIAVPELRAAALVIVGVAVLGGLVIFGVASSNRQAAATLASQPSEAQVQAAGAAMIDFDKHEKSLIDPAQLDIRNLWLTDWNQPVSVPRSSIGDAVIHAVVRNRSPRATLTRIGLTVSLFDCPAHAVSFTGQCDKIGEFTSAVRADIPPGQVREMASQDPYPRDIDHLPPLMGVFRLAHVIDYICASDGSPLPSNSYLANKTDLVCATP